MLKKLLKYEFKATARTMGSMYLAMVAAAALLGFTMRMTIQHETKGFGSQGMENFFASAMMILMLVYVALIIATVVLTIMQVVQRFYKNLLGGEGYLMNTLPVSTRQLLASKTIAGVVWMAASAVVSVLSMLVLLVVARVGEFGLGEWVDMLPQVLRAFHYNTGVSLLNFAAGMVVAALCSCACAVLCIYAACMIGHQIKRFTVPVGIAAYFGLQFVQSTLLSLLGVLAAEWIYREMRVSAINGQVIVSSIPVTAQFWSGVAVLAVPALVFGTLYFFLADWLLREHLNLE